MYLITLALKIMGFAHNFNMGNDIKGNINRREFAPLYFIESVLKRIGEESK